MVGLENDPIFERLGGGNVDIIDKMRYLSKKELAKHRAIVTNQDFQKFQAMDLKNENEISLKDIASDDDYKNGCDDLQELQIQSDHEAVAPEEEEDEEAKNIDNLYEYWQEMDAQKLGVQRERYPNIDMRLEEYLRSHSQQLSLHVQQYLNKI